MGIFGGIGKAEEAVMSPGAAATTSFEQDPLCWKSTLGPPEWQQTLVITESSFQALNTCLHYLTVQLQFFDIPKS